MKRAQTIFRSRPRWRSTALAFAGLTWLIGGSATRAELVTFTLDPAESFLDIDGSFSDVPLVAQPIGEGGDTAKYSGILKLELDNPSSPRTLQFIEGAMAAETTGNWLPELGGGNVGDPEVLGDADPGLPAPGNYGLLLDAGPVGKAWGSFRDLVFTARGEVQDVASNGNFAAGQTFEAIGGTWETTLRSEVLGDDAGSDDVTGDNTLNDAADGHYTVTNGTARIEIPVSLLFVGSVQLQFTGKIVATAQLGGGLKGDFDQSGALDVADIDALSVAVRGGTNPAAFDLNQDGAVDSGDTKIWVEDLKKTWFGDANLDGTFDSADLVETFQAGQYEDGVPLNSTWGTGDWNSSGDFDSGDFVDAFQGGGYELGPRAAVAAVPEPALGPLSLIASVVSSLLIGRRTRRS